MEGGMGGYNSGRSGGRATTDSGLSLGINKLKKNGLLRTGQGSLIWSNTYTGERVADVGYEAHVDAKGGWLRLRYTSMLWDGEQRASDYCITLVTTPQPFGGRRMWFICPR